MLFDKGVGCVEINILPFLIEALSTNKLIRKDIDELYESDKYKFYKAARESEYYNNLVVKEGDIYREVYAKKALGIILCSVEDEALTEKFLKILKKGWPRAFSYVVKNNPVDFEKYLKLLYANKNMHINDFNSEITILYYLARGFDRDITANDGLKIVEDGFDFRSQEYNVDYSVPFFDRLPDTEKQHAAELRKLVFGNIGEIRSYRNLLDIKAELIRNEVRFLSFVFDTEKLNMDTLFAEADINRRDIIEILTGHHLIFGDKNIENDIENIEKRFVAGVIIKCLLKAYKQVKEYFFEHNQETMYFEMQKRDEEIARLKAENGTLRRGVDELSQSLQSERKSLEGKYLQEIRSLKQEIERLNSLLEEERQKDSELNALRELMFSMDVEETYVESVEDVDVSSVKGLIVGGHERWQQRMKELLPNLIFISSENAEVSSILDNVDVVLFVTNYLSHKLYYKVINEARKRNLKIGYISKFNEELALKEIKRCIMAS